MENKYLEALKLHQGIKELRYWMNEPFYINDFAIATDSHTLIKFSKNLVDGLEGCKKENPESILNVISEIRDYNLEINVSEIEKAISKTELLDDFDIIGEDIKCTECLGSGEVEWEYKSWNKDSDCPKCDGEGYESLEIKKPNGNKVYDKNLFIDILESRFSLAIISKLLKTREILDEDKIILVHHFKHNAPSVFKIGEVEVLCMPVIKMDNDDSVILKIS